MQISHALLGYVLKIGQLGSKNLAVKSKNLAVRFDIDQLAAGKSQREQGSRVPSSISLVS
jgi:hypothetical protein